MLKIILEKEMGVNVVNGGFEPYELSEDIDVYLYVQNKKYLLTKVVDLYELENILDPRILKAEIDSCLNFDELQLVEKELKEHDGNYLNYNGVVETMNLNYAKKLEFDCYYVDLLDIPPYMKNTDKEVVLKVGNKEYFIGFGIGMDEFGYDMVCFRKDFETHNINREPIKSGHLSHIIELQEDDLHEDDFNPCIMFDCVDDKNINYNNYFDKRKSNNWYSVKSIYETKDSFILTLEK